MNETHSIRNFEEMTIGRWTSDNHAQMSGVCNVPITPQSRRTFKLMQEDSITLSFTLLEPKVFKVGDFIIDEVFGTFSLRDAQLPKYNKTTSGWDYTLRFDKEYWLWENHIFMLAAPRDETYIETSFDVTDELDSSNTMIVVKPSSSASQGTYARRESKWSLTAPLHEHASQIVANLLSISIQLFGRQVMARIHHSASKAGEVHYISYDGQGICSAMTAMANEYETEWWVTYETINNVNYAVIHFGKCEYPEAPLVFRAGHNMENITASRDLSNYANRLFLFGGSKNIPDSYRKRLYFDIDSSDVVHESGSEPWNVYYASKWVDGNPKFNPYTMLLDKGTSYSPTSYGLEGGSTSNIFSFYKETAYMPVQTVDVEVKHKGLRGYIDFRISTSSAGRVFFNSVMSVELWQQVGNDYQKLADIGTLSKGGEYYFPSAGSTIIRQDIIMPEGTFTIPSGKKCKVRVGMITQTTGDAHTREAYIATPSTEGQVLYPSGKTFKASLIWSDNAYDIMFNPQRYLDGGGRTCEFVFIDSNGDRTSPPSGWSIPANDVLLDKYASTEIPMSWYTDDSDDPSSLVGFGERRLRLPLVDPSDSSITYKDGYIESPDYLEVERKERTLVAEGIYPRCYLRITDVQADDKRVEKMVLSDGTTYEWRWTAYTLQLEHLDGSPFAFEQPFIKSGEKLQAIFLSDIDTTDAYAQEGETIPSAPSGVTDYMECLLAGMTFDVSFINEGGVRKYTILRNEDYGAKLPNEKLRPTIGDVLVLIGWDVKAMEDLGLIAIAENNLLQFGKDYLQALEKDGWTFRCEMMSDWAFLLYGGDGLDTAILDASDGQLKVRQQDTEPYGEDDLLVYLGREGWGTNNGEPNTEYYKLPMEGARVTIEDANLQNGSKTSRVIGYELRLDIPYDSPIIEVGETEAYSRIKQLERKLQDINK